MATLQAAQIAPQSPGGGIIEWARSVARRAARDDSGTFLGLTVAIGILGGMLAFVVQGGSLLLVTMFFPGSPEGVVEAFRNSPWWLRLLIPAAGGFVAGGLRYLLVSDGKRGGMPEILEAVTMGAGILRVRRAAPTALSSLVTFSTGGSVGREGAIVHVTSALSSWLGRMARVERGRLRMLVGCGVAAGVAAAYRTPIGGALFALEVIYGRLAFEELGPIVVASVAATMTAFLLLGQSPLYDVHEYPAAAPLDLLPCIVLGLVAGAAAVLFQEALAASDRAFKGTRLPLPLMSAAGGLLVGAIAIRIPEVTGNGYEGLRAVLAGDQGLTLLAALLVGKLVATCITVGSGGAGGVFTPTLLMGAALGGAFGNGVHALFPALTSSPGAYAVIGMGCLLSATNHAPIMAILIVLEVTRQSTLVLPLMLGAVAAYAVARALRAESIYTASLHRKGITLEAQRQADILRQRSVADILRRNVPLIPFDLPFDTLLRIFRDTRELFLYVGDGDGKLLGEIDLHDMKGFLGESGLGGLIVASDLIRPVRPMPLSATLLEADGMLRMREVGQLPVVEDLESMRYLGIVTRKDLLATVERAILIAEAPELVTPTEEPGRGRLEYMPMPDAYAGMRPADLTEEMIPGEVIGVRRPQPDGSMALLSPRGAVLEKGDLLVVLPLAGVANLT